MAEYECVICTKSEVFVYRIPARTSNRGYRAADWKLDEPDWTGRLRLITKGHQLTMKLDDAATGELFAQCPLESYPSAALEQVLDSSRYFVVRIQDGSGRSAFIGMGFADRGDSFDLLVAVQDHFKRVNRDISAESEQQQNVEGDSKSGSGSTGEPESKLDLAFKEGQTIKINITTKKSGDGASGGTSRQRSKVAGGSGPFLPPPPSPSRHTGAGNGADSTATNIHTTTDRSQPLLDVASSSSSSSRHTEDPNWVSFE